MTRAILCGLTLSIALAACDASVRAGDGGDAVSLSAPGMTSAEPFPVLATSNIPDICAILTKEIAEAGLGSSAQNLSGDRFACDWFAADIAPPDSARGMTLAVVTYPHDQFDSRGAYGSELGQRLLNVTSYAKLDFIDDSEAGSVFLADDGVSTNLLLVPGLHAVSNGTDTPEEAVIWAQLDNRALDRSARKAALEPIARQLALTLISKAEHSSEQETSNDH